MKKMKNLKLKTFLFITLLGAFTLFQSCGSDDGDDVVVVQVNRTVLQTAIDANKAIIANTTEGAAVGQYLDGSQLAFNNAITSAESAFANADYTQSQIDAALVNLANALDVYEAAIVLEIAPEDLVGHWKFDDASGDTVADASGNDFTGTFGAEVLLDATAANPVWTSDRFGTANKAIAFEKGSKITVPYNTAINPAQMTISAWVKVSVSSGNNRFIGLHSWNGYKFQTQDADKAFFTAHTTEGIYDKDTDPALVVGDWYHLAVSVGDGNTTFYINGVQTQQWTDTPGTILPVADHDLVFGVGSSKYAATVDNYDNDSIIPAAWGGFFNGDLDEVRIYKTILTASQVQSIYNAEKP